MTARQSPLAKRLTDTAAGPVKAPAVSPSRLAELRLAAGGRRGEVVEMPILGRVYVELPGALQWARLESEARKATVALGYENSEAIEYILGFEQNIALRALAECTFDPEDHSLRFGSLEEWGDLDTRVVNSAWHVFGDVRERLDPIAFAIPEDEMIAISSAVKKKDARYLRTFGVVKLSAWLATTDLQPSTSPTLSSPSTESAES